MLSCPACGHTISFQTNDFRQPPWCPQCGADWKPAGAKPAASPRQEPEPAAAPDLGGAFAKSPIPAPRPAPRPVEREPEPEASVPDGYMLTEAQDARDGRPRWATGRRGSDIGVLILAGILLTIGGALASWSKQKLDTYGKATGSVVGSSPGRRGGSRPVVSYVAGGRSHTITGGSSSGLFVPAYRLGDRVEVLYPPDDPGNGTINRFADMWLGPTIVGGLGAACLGLWVLGRMSR
jgi:hypothetical protein